MLAGCDSDPGVSEPEPEPQTGPAGAWSIDPVSFRLNLVVDAANGITQDIQGTISGSLTLTESNGALAGSGQCSWTTRKHTARTGQTDEESGSSAFTAAGSLSGDGSVILVLTGCAWNQIGYRGTFSEEGGYALSVRGSGDGPLFGPEVWRDARHTGGDDPESLSLVRP